MILYCKLASIMGLTWVFGFVASATHFEVIRYLFVIFNSLQGLFICLAFVCNRKVFRLLKQRVFGVGSGGQSRPVGQNRSTRV